MPFNRIPINTSSYPHLRQVLRAPLREASDETIEALFETTEITAEDAESFFSNVGSFFSNAARQVSRAMPQIAQIAAPIAQAALPMVGTAIGGPIGGAIGGMAGQALGSLAGQTRPAPPPQAARPAPPAGAAQAAPQPPIGGGAAGQLMQLLGDPRVMQSLSALMMGQAGSRSIPVGNTRVAPSAITNLLGTLAGQATREAMISERAVQGLPDYMAESAYDPADSENRATALFELLQETYPDDVEWGEPEYDEGWEDQSESSDWESIALYEQYYDAFFNTSNAESYDEAYEDQ